MKQLVSPAESVRLQRWMGIVLFAAGAVVRAEIADRQKEPYRKASYADVLAGARKGDPWAAKRMGDMLREGEGLTADPREAAAWYALAAAKGCAAAANNLGVLFKTGEGVPQNSVEAVTWFHRAATQDLAQAQFNLAGCLRQGDGIFPDAEQALLWFRRAADQGYAPGQFETGLMLLNLPPPTGDPEAGFEYLRKAAAQDHAGAQYELGRCYHNGTGVRQSDRYAFRYYLQAAEAGHPEGQKWTGHFYVNGRGVGRNLRKARDWYRKALERMPRDMQILHHLGYIHARGGDGVDRDSAVAVGWYRRAADAGSGLAQMQLGLHLEQGEGAPPDPEAACMWMMLATRGEARDPAMIELGRMLTRLGPDQVRRAAERAAAFRPVAAGGPPRMRIDGLVVDPQPLAAGGAFGFRCRVSGWAPGQNRMRIQCVQRVLRGAAVLFESAPQTIELQSGSATTLERSGLSGGAHAGSYALQIELQSGPATVRASAPLFVTAKRCDP